MLRRRPTRVRGALTVPNRRRILLMLIIEHLLLSAALAICEVVSDLLDIMFWIISSWERGSLGAILGKKNWTLTEESCRRGDGGGQRLHLLTLAHPSAQ
jgi:hypothetical protein